MEQQQQQHEVKPGAAPQDIQSAPPAYMASPQPGTGYAPNDSHAANQPPMPVKELPTDPNAAQYASPQGLSQQPVPGVTPLNQLGDSPQWIDCPFCHRRTMTRITKEGTSMQIVAGVLCCLLCVCLACVPCLAHWFEETYYFCTGCNRKVATRPESGAIIVHGPPTVVPSQYGQSQASPHV